MLVINSIRPDPGVSEYMVNTKTMPSPLLPGPMHGSLTDRLERLPRGRWEEALQ